jgi:hypothetical protein
VVITCLMPGRVQVLVQTAEANWVPLSVVTVAATPKCATQLAMKASVHVLAYICSDPFLPLRSLSVSGRSMPAMLAWNLLVKVDHS